MVWGLGHQIVTLPSFIIHHQTPVWNLFYFYFVVFFVNSLTALLVPGRRQ